MVRPTKGARLGKSPSHERKILANLSKNIIEQNYVTTTLTKAKRVRPYVEKLITMGKKGDLHARRNALKVISDKAVIEKLFTDIAELFKDRNGGYTRITKIGIRKGDNAPLAVIELVGGRDLEDNRPGKPVAKEEGDSNESGESTTDTKDDDVKEEKPKKKETSKKAESSKETTPKAKAEKETPSKDKVEEVKEEPLKEETKEEVTEPEPKDSSKEEDAK